MKIVTYNVNGLKQRVSQYGSLLKLLDSFDADIICFQETKLRRQEMTSDLVMADGYESYFSCTRTVDRGRAGYSGVATFCRVRAAFSSTEVVLPVAAEEGFTGVLGDCSSGGKNGNSTMVALGMEEFERDELVKVDGEGRCVITDHGHFVLFNIYGPRAESHDVERIQFKRNFFRILQRRWEKLLEEGRRILVVGDLNIAPTAMDRCDAGPDFEHNEFRRWFRSLLRKSGGKFSDVFRAKHPDRTDAYTCWPTNTGAEQFNYGTRIDHILCAGSCLHEDCESQEHDFLTCHIRECDILTEYKRWKPGSMQRFRWKGGLGIKLEGSDHAPVSASLKEIPDINQHSTPSLSSRYLPMICGLQQTLVSVLMKRQAVSQVQSGTMSSSVSEGNLTISRNSETVNKSCSTSTVLRQCSNEVCSLNESNSEVSETSEHSKDFPDEACPNSTSRSSAVRCEKVDILSGGKPTKRARKDQWSQLSLKSFFQKSPNVSKEVETSSQNELLKQSEGQDQDSNHSSCRKPTPDDQSSNPEHCPLTSSSDALDHDEVRDDSPEKPKNNAALLEWQRIQQLMQNSIPLCKGHKEPCVSRVVKKPGPSFGHRFYVCARAEGPASNPEANCGYFKWASSKFRQKQ